MASLGIADGNGVHVSPVITYPEYCKGAVTGNVEIKNHQEALEQAAITTPHTFLGLPEQGRAIGAVGKCLLVGRCIDLN